MSDSIEEIISRSIGEGIGLNDSCELTKVINSENDSLNMLKNVKEHLENQGILPILFQIQKEVYNQVVEKLVQEHMATQFANKIVTMDELKKGMSSFINSFHMSYKKLNNAVISVIGQKYSQEFFNNSSLNQKNAEERDDNPHKEVPKESKQDIVESSPINVAKGQEKSIDELLDKSLGRSIEQENSFYSEIDDECNLLKLKNESTIMKILPSNDKESTDKDEVKIQDSEKDQDYESSYEEESKELNETSSSPKLG